jgi:hypothetical protein
VKGDDDHRTGLSNCTFVREHCLGEEFREKMKGDTKNRRKREYFMREEVNLETR